MSMKFPLIFNVNQVTSNFVLKLASYRRIVHPGLQTVIIFTKVKTYLHKLIKA